VFRLANKPQNAEAYLEDAIDFAQSNSPGSHDVQAQESHEASLASVVQCLVEIRFSQGRFDDAATLLTQLEDQRALGDIHTPFLQRVMLAICQHRAGSRALASVAFNEFFASTGAAIANPHLMWHVGEACMDGRDYAKAIKAYDAIHMHEAYAGEMYLFLRRAKAHQVLKQFDLAERDIRHVLTLAPGNSEAMLSLTRLQSKRERAAKNAASGISDSDDDDSDSDSHDEDDDADADGVLRETAKKRRQRKLKAATRRARVGLSRLSSANPSSMRANSLASARRNAAALTATIGRSLLSLADQAYESGDKVKYFMYLAPVLESALHVPTNNLVCLFPPFAEPVVLPPALRAISRDDLHALGHAMMRNMADARFVEFAERVFESLKACGHADDKNNVPELLVSLGRNRVKGDDILALRLRFLYISCLLAHGDLDGAFDELRAIAKDRDSDDRVWWMYSVVDGCAMAMDIVPLRTRLFRSITRQSKRPNPSMTAMMMAANCSGRGASMTKKLALPLLVRLADRIPSSPLVALTTATTLFQHSRSRTAVKQDQIILKGFAYLDEYRRLRRSQFSGLSVATRSFAELECDYNVGRALHDVGLVHMAAEMYEAVIDRDVPRAVSPQENVVCEPACWPVWLDVKREAAFNLVHIYRNSGSHALALAILRRHLVF
jgi:tetratricopeptide (TPR) repeat protein